MVYARRLNDENAAQAQAEMDAELEKLRQVGFLAAPKPKQGQSARPVPVRIPIVVKTRSPSVVVEMKPKARLSDGELCARRAAAALQRKKTQEKVVTRTESPKVDEAAEARKDMRNSYLPIAVRIMAAECLGYTVTYRGPEDHPRRIIFRHPRGKLRIAIMFPKGRTKRREAMAAFNRR